MAFLRDHGWNPPPLVVAGPNGWLAEETLGLIGTLQLEERVRIIGSPNVDEQPLLYNAAQLFLFPSLYEGFGLPPIEAMACGTPVIAATTPALNEVLGRGAVFVHPKDVEGWAKAIHRLVEDVPARMRLGQDGRARAARFRWQDTAQSYLELYRRVAA
jgi:glycosyltransferase involved in cell wall biosynthesis